MFCWQARRGFADTIEGNAEGALARHLDACASCRAELGALRRVAVIVSETARVQRVESAFFEETILREGRARRAAIRRSQPSLRPLLRPLPLGAALALMLAAVALAYFLNAASAIDTRVPATRTVAAQSPTDDDLEDGVVPPREVPFVLQEDLVGTRRGRIPLTTYVLEPAPEDKPVLRASL